VSRRGERAYPTFSELLPTPMLAGGIGSSVALGRIGAAVSPSLLVAIAGHSSMLSAFTVVAGFRFLDAAL
jgi:hypothetical protein